MKAFEERIPRIYPALRRSAYRRLRNVRDLVMQPTMLVNETFLKLATLRAIQWRGDTHLLAVARIQMRRVLLDHLRAGRRLKRTLPGEASRVEPTQPAGQGQQALMELALARLEHRHPRGGRVARLRIESELDTSTIAVRLRVSERTVRNDWRFARAYISRQLMMESPAEG